MPDETRPLILSMQYTPRWATALAALPATGGHSTSHPRLPRAAWMWDWVDQALTEKRKTARYFGPTAAILA